MPSGGLLILGTRRGGPSVCYSIFWPVKHVSVMEGPLIGGWFAEDKTLKLKNKEDRELKDRSNTSRRIVNKIDLDMGGARACRCNPGVNSVSGMCAAWWNTRYPLAKPSCWHVLLGSAARSN